MSREGSVKVFLTVGFLALAAFWVSVAVRPARADAADDLVREVSKLADAMGNTNRSLEKIADQLEGIRRSVEGAGILDIDSTSSDGGRGIPVVIQNP
jgi:hypothetical protein